MVLRSSLGDIFIIVNGGSSVFFLTIRSQGLEEIDVEPFVPYSQTELLNLAAERNS